MLRDPLRMRPVVGIMEGDVIACGLRHSLIFGAISTKVLCCLKYFQTRIPRLALFKSLHGGVSAAVVHDNDLKVAVRLLLQGAQSVKQRIRTVEGGHNDSNHGTTVVYSIR